MHSDESIAAKYLAPSRHAFWCWSDDEDAITWKDGTTIVFRSELCEILSLLAPNGLPPINAVLLMISAARASWLTATPKIGILSAALRDPKTSEVPVWFSELIGGLDKIRNLPEHLRESPRAKAITALTVFESTMWKTSADEARAVVRSLQSREFIEFESLDVDAEMSASELYLDLLNLRFGLDRVESESLELRMRTGLEQLVTPAEAESPLSDRVRQLLRLLVDDEELSGFARVARQLMGIVHLPREIMEFDDLPVGGVSDISNRGPLDRLLLSELAQDDETLTVRVAMNEALYLRRESPPYSPPSCRAILIDTGIRMWGVPRVLAAAVAMSLCATADQKTRVEVFRAAGIDVDAVKLDTKEHLIEHLEVLEHDAHPGHSLPAFEQALSDEEINIDAILITTDDTVTDPEFRRTLVQSQFQQIYLATVDRTGSFALESWTPLGSKPNCQAQLLIDDLLKQPTKPTIPLIDERADPSLPLILSMARFPFLLPHAIDWKNMWHADGHGVFSITNDGRLMLWKDRTHAAMQLRDDIGRRNLIASGEPRRGFSSAVLGNPSSSPLQLVNINLANNETTLESIHLYTNSPQHVVFVDQFLVVSYRRRYDIFDPITGELFDRSAYMQTMRQFQGRFVRAFHTSEWFRLHWQDGSIATTPVESSRIDPHKYVCMMERRGYGGTIALTDDGRLRFLESETLSEPLIPSVSPNDVRVVSQDGRFVVVDRFDPHQSFATPKNFAFYVIDIDEQAAKPTLGNPHVLAAPQLARTVKSRTLRNRFRRIATVDGELVLVSRKNRYLTIARGHDRSRLILSETRSSTVHSQEFDLIKSPNGTLYQLRRASWNDGSEAFLDSRGMLHLKSSDRSIPEISLVMDQKGIAAWCSNGWMFGPENYLGDKGNATIEQVEGLLKKFVARLR